MERLQLSQCSTVVTTEDYIGGGCCLTSRYATHRAKHTETLRNHPLFHTILKDKCGSIETKAHPITDAPLNGARDSSAASWNLSPVPQLLANTLQQHHNCPVLTYLASSAKGCYQRSNYSSSDHVM